MNIFSVLLVRKFFRTLDGNLRIPQTYCVRRNPPSHNLALKVFRRAALHINFARFNHDVLCASESPITQAYIENSAEPP